MGFLELAHCYYCGVTLDKRISDHGPDCPYRRGETPGLNAWLLEQSASIDVSGKELARHAACVLYYEGTLKSVADVWDAGADWQRSQLSENEDVRKYRAADSGTKG